MIIGFSLENWMSFRNEVTFSMVAGRERMHGDRLPKVGKYRMRLLPITAIYGGNASGKTNFFKALSFAKGLIVEGTRPDGAIPVEPFRLGATDDKPSRFGFELLIDETIYEFSFAVTAEAVLEEKLVVVKSTSETVLYHRHKGRLTLDTSLRKDRILDAISKTTRDNQLFLTHVAGHKINAATKKIDKLRPVYNWFRDTLELIAANFHFAPSEQFIDEKHPDYVPLNEMLEQLDTGIVRLGSEEISFKDAPLPESLKAGMQAVVQEGRPVPMSGYSVARKGGELTARKVVAWHPKVDGTELKFEIEQASDGTKRVINLLPAFFALLLPTKKVFVIDEIDRSLHPLLLHKLLEVYLYFCDAETRNQLVFTAHDTALMDQILLRRDEMWVTERDDAEASQMHSFSEYQLRYDQDIRRFYLQRRLGGIPFLQLRETSGSVWVEKARGDA